MCRSSTAVRLCARLSSISRPWRRRPAPCRWYSGSGWPGILLHEAIGHGLEGDFNRKGTSAFSNRIGQKVAADEITVVDDGTLDRRRGSLNVDDEGTPTQCTVLIEKGVLKGYIQDKLNARLMGMPATGNGRRESFAHMTLPRMTNTYMRAGSRAPEEIIASVKKGLYAVNFGGGQVDITSGKFVFSASEAYLIENGKIGAPVKGATLIGNGPDVLHPRQHGGQRHEARRRGRDLRQGRPIGAGRSRAADAAHRRADRRAARASGLICSGPGLRYRLRSFSSERSHEISSGAQPRSPLAVLRIGVRLAGRPRSRGSAGPFTGRGGGDGGDQSRPDSRPRPVPGRRSPGRARYRHARRRYRRPLHRHAIRALRSEARGRRRRLSAARRFHRRTDAGWNDGLPGSRAWLARGSGARAPTTW